MTVAAPKVLLWDGANRRIFLKSGVSDFNPIEDLYHEYRYQRRTDEELRKFNALIKAEGNVSKGGGAFTPRYVVLLDGTKIVPFNETLQINQRGDIITDNADVDPSLYDVSGLTVAKPIYIQPSEAETIQLNSDDIEYSSFNGGVHFDLALGKTLAEYPVNTIVGNFKNPVNNIADAIAVQSSRGLPNVLYIYGYTDFGPSDVLTEWKLIGTNSKKDHVHTFSGGIFTDCELEGLHVAGTYYGDTTATECRIASPTLSGTLKKCVYTGTVTMNGDLEVIGGTSGIPGMGSPIFDCQNTYDIQIRGYLGGSQIINKTSGSGSFDILSGHLELASSVSGGMMVVRDSLHFDNNAAGAAVMARGLSAASFDSMRALIEFMRSTHQATGTVFYFDPTAGQSGFDGRTKLTPKPTINEALALCTSGHNDQVICLNQSGAPYTHAENVVIIKNNVHLRFETRNLTWITATPGGDVLTIGGPLGDDGYNCSVSGCLIDGKRGSGATAAANGIVVRGKMSLLDGIWVKQCETDLVSYRGGDYHVGIDMELEKVDRHGISFIDEDLNSGNPREVTFGGRSNIYLCSGNAIHIDDDGVGPIGQSTRIVRILSGEITDNTGFAIYSGTYVKGITLGKDVVIHGNNGGHGFPQVQFLDPEQVHDDLTERYEHQADHTWEAILEGTFTAAEVMRAVAAVLAGKVNGAQTGTEIFRNLSDTKDVVTSTVDASGNRTNIALDVTP